MHVPFLRLGVPLAVRGAIDDAYERVLRSGEYLRGKEVVRFEEQWAGYVGTKYCVATQSGGEALRIVIGCWNRSANWNIAVPWNSQPTVDSLYNVPREKMVLQPTGEDLNVLARSRVGGYVWLPVHLYGNPCRMEQFEEDSQWRGPIFEDACQAHGAKYRGKKCGSLARAAAWSFYPTKNLGALGDAGAITTDDEQLAAEIRELRYARMDALQAAFLCAKLKYLDSWNATRKEIAHRYLSELRGIQFPRVNDGAEPNWHLFVVLHPNRARLAQDLWRAGVETMTHYPIDDRVLSLPCNPWVMDDEVEYVIEQVNRHADQSWT